MLAAYAAPKDEIATIDPMTACIVFGSETSKCGLTVMSMLNLVDDTLMYRVRNNLAESRQIRVGYGAVWFNVLMFLLIGGLALSFLVAQYHSTKHVLQSEESRKNIPREELFWNNSVRNRIDM